MTCPTLRISHASCRPAAAGAVVDWSPDSTAPGSAAGRSASTPRSVRRGALACLGHGTSALLGRVPAPWAVGRTTCLAVGATGQSALRAVSSHTQAAVSAGQTSPGQVVLFVKRKCLLPVSKVCQKGSESERTSTKVRERHGIQIAHILFLKTQSNKACHP